MIREAHPEEVPFYSFSYLLSVFLGPGANPCPAPAQVPVGEKDKKGASMQVPEMTSEKEKSWKECKGPGLDAAGAQGVRVASLKTWDRCPGQSPWEKRVQGILMKSGI